MSDVGRYRVVRALGRGGMAEVLEAVAAGEGGFERRVAIKRLLPGSETDAALVRMFVDEARIASQLHHPGIVPVIDYGITEGGPFLVMEYVDGTDLGKLADNAALAGQPLTPELIGHIGSEVAHGLAYAHEAQDMDGRPLGIVHRDVSPGNILVAWSGQVRLTDFGIAMAHRRTETTQAGSTKGTPLYMAVEQATGGQVDGRTDVFSLGCVLHRLAAGQSPLAGDNVVMDVIAGGEIPLAEGLPPDLEQIIRRATRRAKSERFPTARAMADALDAAVAARVGQDPRPTFRQWLSSQRPAKSQRGRLDDLLAFDLVPTGTASGDDVRQFAERPTESTPPRDAVPDDTSVVKSGPPWRALAIGVGFAIGGTTAAVLEWPQPAAEELATSDPPPSPPPDPVPAFVTPPPPAPATTTSSAEDTTGADRAGTTTAVVSDVRPTVRPPKTPVTEPPVDAGPAYLKIGGTGALRAEIRVDGVAKGFAPKKLVLPAGPHEVVLVGPDGKVRARKKLELTARHTRSAPFSWSVP